MADNQQLNGQQQGNVVDGEPMDLSIGNDAELNEIFSRPSRLPGSPGNVPQPEQIQEPVQPQDNEQVVLPDSNPQAQPQQEFDESELDAALPQLEQEQQSQEQQTEQQTPEDASPSDRMKELQRLFKEEMGVDVSEAVENMNSFNETSQQVLESIRQAEERLTLRQQEFELSQAWASEVPPGQNVRQVVNDRVERMSRVYSQLNDTMKQRIAAAGTDGMLALWRSMNKGQQSAPGGNQIRSGRADIASSQQQSDSQNLSALMASDDDDAFWAAMQNRNFVNDVGFTKGRARQ